MSILAFPPAGVPTTLEYSKFGVLPSAERLIWVKSGGLVESRVRVRYGPEAVINRTHQSARREWPSGPYCVSIGWFWSRSLSTPSGNRTHSSFVLHQTATLGSGNPGSAKHPTGMPITSGNSSRDVLTVELHRGQKLISTFLPDAPLREYVEALPERPFTWFAFHRDARAKALPERF
jgi:hypothetical protein